MSSAQPGFTSTPLGCHQATSHHHGASNGHPHGQMLALITALKGPRAWKRGPMPVWGRATQMAKAVCYWKAEMPTGGPVWGLER